MYHYYFIINMQHPCLSKTELERLIETIDKKTSTKEYTGIVIASLTNDEKARKIQSKSATIKETGRIITVTEATPQSIYNAIINTGYCPNKKPYIKPLRIQRIGKQISQEEVTEIIIKALKNNCGEKRKFPNKEKITIRPIYTDGVIIIGELISREKKGQIISQNPHNLPFYKPGALNPWFTRLLVNLSLSKEKKKILYDPFCGTGTIPITSINEWKIEAVCSDIRRDMCAGARKNLENLATENMFHIIRADARKPPFREDIFTSIVTDPPYGRSVRSIASTEEQLAQNALNSMPGILRNKGYIIVSLPIEISEKIVLPPKLKIRKKCLMYVHNQLTRKIMVIEKIE